MYALTMVQILELIVEFFLLYTEGDVVSKVQRCRLFASNCFFSMRGLATFHWSQEREWSYICVLWVSISLCFYHFLLDILELLAQYGIFVFHFINKITIKKKYHEYSNHAISECYLYLYMIDNCLMFKKIFKK